ncbi:DUF3089 domain-containing protein [Aldersonia sp. NBC_00410]|uniref:DUF3089 domain-containing protein n=1 Tax=Aldersonia sp. NBC_00410 TaxID=2975954 RepID=UPI002258E5B1|nr:DUF3089 domain-containing protein [Aldersonia sp. NBC_00410]MCX5043021.1 DUF3089 domain-containing protein [Aldersonia sp. NBC_00410]
MSARTTIARIAAAAFTFGLGAAVLSAPAVDAAPPAGNTVWLCHPAIADDPCDLPQDTTDLSTGLVSAPPAVAEADKPVDCFYIYPTSSDQVALNADRTAQPAVQSIASVQAARFNSQCRMFAPVYRQWTVPLIAAVFVDPGIAQVAYSDVLAAWNDYLAHDNDGRGVIFIGHSQGTVMLRKLIREQIDPNPELRNRMVGGFLMGGNVLTARGSDIGGDFANIPVCTRQGQNGCVVAYSTTQTDPALSLFGNSQLDLWSRLIGLPSGPAFEVACTDPAALSGDHRPVGLTVPSAPFAVGALSAMLDYTVFPKGSPRSASTWTTSSERATGSCVDKNGYRFYQFRGIGPDAQLVNEIPLLNAHVVDINLGLDRLVNIAGQQARSWLAGR